MGGRAPRPKLITRASTRIDGIFRRPHLLSGIGTYLTRLIEAFQLVAMENPIHQFHCACLSINCELKPFFSCPVYTLNFSYVEPNRIKYETSSRLIFYASCRVKVGTILL